MTQSQDITTSDAESIARLLSGSGYSDKAIKYFLEKADMGSLPDADQVTELTGPCGDTIKIIQKAIAEYKSNNINNQQGE